MMQHARICKTSKFTFPNNVYSRSVEKRKQAATELQEYIERLMEKNQFDTINTRITVFAAMVNPDSSYGVQQQQERDNP